MRQHYHLSPGEKVNPAELSKYLDEIGRRLAAIESTHRIEGLPIPSPLGNQAARPVGKVSGNLSSSGSVSPGASETSPAGTSPGVVEGSGLFNPGIILSRQVPVPGGRSILPSQRSLLLSLPSSNLVPSSATGLGIQQININPVVVANNTQVTLVTTAGILNATDTDTVLFGTFLSSSFPPTRGTLFDILFLDQGGFPIGRTASQISQDGIVSACTLGSGSSLGPGVISVAVIQISGGPVTINTSTVVGINLGEIAV